MCSEGYIWLLGFDGDGDFTVEFDGSYHKLTESHRKDPWILIQDAMTRNLSKTDRFIGIVITPAAQAAMETLPLPPDLVIPEAPDDWKAFTQEA